MRKSAKRDLVLPLDATLHYLPDEYSFSIEEYPELSLTEAENWEVFSMGGAQIGKEAFLYILQKRSIEILGGRRSPTRPHAKISPVAVPICILGLSLENSVTSFQLLGHAHPE